MTSLRTIQEFLSDKEIAIAGVSRNTKKFGRVVYDHLIKRGYKIYPVNPNTDTIENAVCYPDVTSLPDKAKKLLIVTKKDQTFPLVNQALEKGIKQIWIQQMSETKEAIDLAQKKNIDLITKECILMFAEPVKGGHKFHRFFNKLFGRYPK